MKPLYSELLDEYAAPWTAGNVTSEQEFRLRAQAKERHGGKGITKLKTRNYERALFETARDRNLIKPAGNFGLRLLILSKKRRGDVSNILKAIEDAMNRMAYQDDSAIDYLQLVRSVDQPRDLSILQVIEQCNR